MREVENLIRREQLFVHLCICAFVLPMCQQNHRKKTNTQKTTSDGNCSTMLICLFVYLCIHQHNHSLTVHKLVSTWLTLEITFHFSDHSDAIQPLFLFLVSLAACYFLVVSCGRQLASSKKQMSQKLTKTKQQKQRGKNLP